MNSTEQIQRAIDLLQDVGYVILEKDEYDKFRDDARIVRALRANGTPIPDKTWGMAQSWGPA